MASDLELTMDMLHRSRIGYTLLKERFIGRDGDSMGPVVCLRVDGGYTGFFSELAFSEKTGALVSIRAWED